MLPVNSASGGGAPVITVDTTVDDGNLDACTDAANDCSLRGALEGFAALNHVDGVFIDIMVPAGDYVLDEEIFMVESNVRVHGAGAGATIVTVESVSAERILELNTDGELSVALLDMTFTGGLGAGGGGAILTNGGPNLTILRMHFVDNLARGPGGAISANGNVVADTLVIVDTTFASNGASEEGGAIHVGSDESASIINSTFTDNTGALGGAIFVGDIDSDNGSEATLTHVTMSGNAAFGFQGPGAGAIGVGDGATVTVAASVIENSTEGSNPVPPAVAAVGDPITNCEVVDGGTLTSDGHNVVDDDTCHATEGTDQPDAATDAQALGDNGGPTFTMALLAASPAVDAAGATCAAVGAAADQRGIARPQDGNEDGTNGCDSGAYELAPTPEAPPAVAPAAQPDFTG